MVFFSALIFHAQVMTLFLFLLLISKIKKHFLLNRMFENGISR